MDLSGGVASSHTDMLVSGRVRSSHSARNSLLGDAQAPPRATSTEASATNTGSAVQFSAARNVTVQVATQNPTPSAAVVAAKHITAGARSRAGKSKPSNAKADQESSRLEALVIMEAEHRQSLQTASDATFTTDLASWTAIRPFVANVHELLITKGAATRYVTWGKKGNTVVTFFKRMSTPWDGARFFHLAFIHELHAALEAAQVTHPDRKACMLACTPDGSCGYHVLQHTNTWSQYEPGGIHAHLYAPPDGEPEALSDTGKPVWGLRALLHRAGLSAHLNVASQFCFSKNMFDAVDLLQCHAELGFDIGRDQLATHLKLTPSETQRLHDSFSDVHNFSYCTHKTSNTLLSISPPCTLASHHLHVTLPSLASLSASDSL